MSEVAVVEDDPAGEAGLSQMERVAGVFLAPTRVFEDIRRSASWWLPFVLTTLLGLVFALVVLGKIGLPAMVDGIAHQQGALEERLANASPEQAATMQQVMEIQFLFLYGGPGVLLVAVVVAGLLTGTANFVFGGRAKYKQVLAVWIYGTLPLSIALVLTILVVLSGEAGSSFNIRNTVGTNIGYYLMNTGAPQWEVALLGSADILSIWAALLVMRGVATVAGIKRSSAAAVVFGWWAVYIAAKTVIAAFTG